MAAQMNPIWHQLTTAHSMNSARSVTTRNASQDRTQDTAPTAAATTNSGSDSTDAATVSANDFLTLLVTEMKNQDPTANTDPNEYINQLVQVNSLEQLISINQTLTADASANPTGHVVRAVSQQHSTVPSTLAGGNLSVPESIPAAQRVAGSLGAPTHRL